MINDWRSAVFGSSESTAQHSSEQRGRARGGEADFDIEAGLFRVGDDSLQSDRAGDVDPAKAAQMDVQLPRIRVSGHELGEAVLEYSRSPEPEDTLGSQVE